MITTTVTLVITFLLFIPAIPLYFYVSSFFSFAYGSGISVLFSLLFGLSMLIMVIILYRIKLKENFMIRKGILINCLNLLFGAFLAILNVVLLLIMSSVDEPLGSTLYYLLSPIDFAVVVMVVEDQILYVTIFSNLTVRRLYR